MTPACYLCQCFAKWYPNPKIIDGFLQIVQVTKVKLCMVLPPLAIISIETLVLEVLKRRNSELVLKPCSSVWWVEASLLQLNTYRKT